MTTTNLDEINMAESNVSKTKVSNRRKPRPLRHLGAGQNPGL